VHSPHAQLCVSLRQNAHARVLQTHLRKLLRTWFRENVLLQTLIIALLLTVIIFVPQVFIARASVAVNPTVLELQEVMLKKMCVVCVTVMALRVSTVQEHQMVMLKKMRVVFAKAMAPRA